MSSSVEYLVRGQTPLEVLRFSHETVVWLDLFSAALYTHLNMSTYSSKCFVQRECDRQEVALVLSATP